MYFPKREVISKRFGCIIHLWRYPTYYKQPVTGPCFFQDFLRRRIPGADTGELPNGSGPQNIHHELPEAEGTKKERLVSQSHPLFVEQGAKVG